nr:hypothetical protein A6C57_16935 [Fibrella sp. ES10-3-2-2]
MDKLRLLWVSRSLAVDGPPNLSSMKLLLNLVMLLSLCGGLLSCLDHRGIAPIDEQRTRLKRRFIESISSDTGLPTVSSVEFSYDSLNRLVGVLVYDNEKNGPSTPILHSVLRYDAQGKLLDETYVDEPGGLDYSRHYTYEYDSTNRIARVYDRNNVVMVFTYDAQNRVTGRTTYTYNYGTYLGTVLALRTFELYDLDAANNISLYRQTYVGVRGQGYSTFRRQIEATFDHYPNPTYHLPTMVVYQLATVTRLFSANNPMVETQYETTELTGEFPAGSAKLVTTHDREYQNGLLVKDTVSHVFFTLVYRYEYEQY